MKLLNFDLKVASEERLLKLNKMDEFRLDAYENAKLYKEHTKRWHDKHLIRRDFMVGERVLLFNTRLKLFPSKLKSRWTGPYEITKVFPFRDVEVTHLEKGTFKVNGQRLKLYIDGGVLDFKVTIDLQDLPKS